MCFFLCGAGWIWRFFENRHTLRVSNHLFGADAPLFYVFIICRSRFD